MAHTAAQRIQFGEFELDTRAGELRKGKRRIRLQEQPFQILLMLLERPGEVVTREQICARLWPDNTIVEFEHSIATAIKKLRQALDDEAVNPRYVETLPRRGFRFIYPDVVVVEAAPEAGAAESAAAQAGGGQAGQSTEPPAAAAPAFAVTQAAGSRRARLLAMAGAVAVCALGLVLWRHFAASQIRGEPDESTLTQVTTSASLDVDPSLSPDGSSIAYSSDQSGRFEIYVKSLELGGREMQLTNDGGGNFEPAWSPDGKQIAFYSTKHGGIWVMPALGGTPHLLTEFGSWPAWSPDGTKVAFQSGGHSDVSVVSYAAAPPSTIWIVPAQGGAPTQLTKPGNPSGGHGAPTWSPDGKRIAFSTTSTGLGEVWSAPSDGGQPICLVRKFGYDPVYAPNGRELYFSLGWTASWVLMKVELKPDGSAAGDPVVVMNTGQVLYKHLNFSADGRFMAFTAMGAKNEIGSVHINPATGEATGSPELLTNSTSGRKTSPMFSPDGKMIAFSEVQIGAGASVRVMDPNGKNSRPVIAGMMAPRLLLPGWLPSSQRMAIYELVNGKTFLETLDINSGRRERMREVDVNDTPLRVSPDGKQIAFGRRQGGAINVWTAPLAGGAGRQLTFEKGTVSYPCWSPDGKYLVVEEQTDPVAAAQIAVIPSNGGALLQLTHDPGAHWPSDWSPDGDKIVYAGISDGVWNLYWVSRRTKEEKQVTHYTSTNTYVRYPTWSPRGDQIAYEYAETTGNIWMMRVK